MDALGKALQVAPQKVIDRIPTDILRKRGKIFRMRCTLKRIRDALRSRIQEAIA